MYETARLEGVITDHGRVMRGTPASAHLDGDWVTPPQMTSWRPDGLALVGWHFLDWDTARAEYQRIRDDGGYYEGSPLRRRLARTLGVVGLGLEDVYVRFRLPLQPDARCDRRLAVTRNRTTALPIIPPYRHARTCTGQPLYSAFLQ